MKNYKSYRVQYIECKEKGILFEVPCIHCQKINLICQKYKCYCSSKVCLPERISKTK